jgi:hypothetical protein
MSRSKAQIPAVAEKNEMTRATARAAMLNQLAVRCPRLSAVASPSVSWGWWARQMARRRVRIETASKAPI